MFQVDGFAEVAVRGDFGCQLALRIDHKGKAGFVLSRKFL
jgi:hypothetical protein